MAASRTEMNVKNADTVASFASAEKVLGREQTQQIMVEITANVMVHWLWFVMVLKYLALTSTWRP